MEPVRPAPTPEIRLRALRYPADHAQIEEMCKTVYAGHDSLPRDLKGHAEDESCFPHVLADGEEIVAFASLRLLKGERAGLPCVYLEAVRVLGARRGAGLARRLCTGLCAFARRELADGRPLRIMSTSMWYNEPMLRIFRTCGMEYSFSGLMWPAGREVEPLRVAGESVETGLELGPLISARARSSVSDWVQLTARADIKRVLEELKACGASGMRLDWFNVITTDAAAMFLEEKASVKEERSVWKLKRDSLPPVLLFVRRNYLSMPQFPSEGFISACMARVEDLEYCVAFLSFLKRFDIYRMSIDYGGQENALERSPLLSKARGFGFIVYEGTLDVV